MSPADAMRAELDEVKAALRELTNAASDMLTGVEIHNRLGADAPARRDNIEGPVVRALASATHRARQALNPTPSDLERV